MISPYVDMLQRTVCKWNHCSIRIEDTIIHFFDPDVLPRWTSTAADERLYKTYHDIYIGDCNLEDVRNFTNKFLQFSWYDGFCRHLWYYTMGLWPKRRDCVDKCSATLTYLFNIPRCYSTPDKLVELVHEYNRNKGIR
jgi:hypothetical protein